MANDERILSRTFAGGVGKTAVQLRRNDCYGDQRVRREQAQAVSGQIRAIPMLCKNQLGGKNIRIVAQ